MDRPKFIIYDGKRFCRDDKTGYYLNSTNGIRLHRYVWEKEIGKIPKGYEIHHIDRNKSNNEISNLRLMSEEEHRNWHAHNITEEQKQKMRKNLIENAIPKSKEWHKSEQGKEWHREHINKIIQDRGTVQLKMKLVCENCGKEFEGYKNSKFCSNNCKSQWRRKQGLDNVERVCVICGKSFITYKYNKTQTCSNECAGKKHTQTNKIKREAKNVQD